MFLRSLGQRIGRFLHATRTGLAIGLLALIPAHLAHASPSLVTWINLRAVPNYGVSELPSKTMVLIGEENGKFGFFSVLEFDNLTNKLKYRNFPNDKLNKTDFLECNGSFTALPQREYPNTDKYYVEFTLPNCDGLDVTGIVKIDGAMYPSREFVPMCDTKNSPIGALTSQVAGLSTERDQLDELLTGFKNDLDRTKKELSTFQKSEATLNTENDKLKRTVSLQTGTINILNQKNTTLRKQNARYASQVSALQRQVAVLQAQIAKIK